MQGRWERAGRIVAEPSAKLEQPWNVKEYSVGGAECFLNHCEAVVDPLARVMQGRWDRAGRIGAEPSAKVEHPGTSKSFRLLSPRGDQEPEPFENGSSLLWRCSPW